MTATALALLIAGMGAAVAAGFAWVSDLGYDLLHAAIVLVVMGMVIGAFA